MNLRNTFIFTTLGVAASCALFAAPPPEEEYTASPCNHIEIRSSLPISFNSNETLLICGDSESVAWAQIPTYQARSVLRAALESRGFLQPEFVSSDGKLLVKAGLVTRVTQIQITFKNETGAAVSLDSSRYWVPLGKVLTPAVLDEIRAFVAGQMAEKGYPCPTIDIKADRSTGYILLEVDPGQRWVFRKIVSQGIPGVLGNVETRFFAMNEGDPYNAQKLQLTSQRLVTSGLVLDASFSPRCNLPDPGIVQLDVLTGAPRLFSFGFGFDTESFLMSRVAWEHSRLFTSASRASAEGFFSYRKQVVQSGFDWYYLPFVSRHFLANKVTVMQKIEPQFKTTEIKGVVTPAWQRDFSASSLRLQMGPSFHGIKTVRGPGRDYTSLISLEASAQARTHDFEYFRASPRSGHEVTFETTRSLRAVGSDLNIEQHHLASTHLWNLAHWNPPIFIFGLRNHFAIVRPGKGTNPEDVPASFRLFLGGIDNLRGFGRNRLPANEDGALITAYSGSELRINEILPYRLQPLVFADVALLGTDSMEFELENIYWSPGVGTRWESPIGSMRFSLGHGLVAGPRSDELANQQQWQFYFSFGDTF